MFKTILVFSAGRPMTVQFMTGGGAAGGGGAENGVSVKQRVGTRSW